MTTQFQRDRLKAVELGMKGVAGFSAFAEGAEYARKQVVQRLRALTVHDVRGLTFGGAIEGKLIAASDVAAVIAELEAP